MSLEAMVWAANHAPTADVYEFAVLMKMADQADGVGRGVWFYQPALAARIRGSDRKLRDALTGMKERGLIALGDQRRVAHIRPDKRPIVYDLMIPYAYFRDVDRVNDELARKGEPVITRQNRPDLPPPPPMKRRADLGKAKRRNVGTSDDPTGGIQVRPSDDSDGSDPTGGIQVRAEYKSEPGGIQVRTGRSSIPTKQSLEQLENPPPPSPDHEPSGSAAQERKVEEDRAPLEPDKTQPETALAVRVLTEVLHGVPIARKPRGAAFQRLVALLVEHAVPGWDQRALVQALSGEFDTAHKVYSALDWRIRLLGQEPAPSRERPPRIPPQPVVKRPCHTDGCVGSAAGGYVQLGKIRVACPDCKPVTHRKDLERLSGAGYKFTTFDELRLLLQARTEHHHLVVSRAANE